MDVQIDVTGKTLETQRLILRQWQESDLNDFYDYACVEGVGEMAGWKHHETIFITNEVLQSFISDKNVFAVVLKQNNKVIGSLGLHYSWANDDPNFNMLRLKDIGYVLSKNYWGNGLMPEAVSAIIKFCFNDCGLDAVTIAHFLANSQSKRVIEKCGFQYVKQGEYFSEPMQKGFADLKYILYR